jgi:hydrogenase small subunit
MKDTLDLTVGEMLLKHGVSRRGFVKFCTATVTAMALPPWMGVAMAEQLRRSPRPSVIYLSFQECTGCFESFTCSYAPTIENLMFNVISLDYDDTLMAASGEAAKGARVILAVGTCSSFGGIPFADPNPTNAWPVSAIVGDTPIINVSGCPPIPEVITGTLKARETVGVSTSSAARDQRPTTPVQR